MNWEPRLLVILSARTAEDVPLRDELARHLDPWATASGSDVWHEGHIQGGEPLAVLDQQISSARVVVALLSPDLLADRRRVALAEHAVRVGIRVVPVIVRACVWQASSFRDLSVLPSGDRTVLSFADRGDAWNEVADTLDRHWGASPRLLGDGVPSVGTVGRFVAEPSKAGATQPHLSNPGQQDNGLPLDLIRALADEYPDVRDVRALWERAGGRGSEVESIPRPLDLWQRLWLRSSRGASVRPAALLRKALEDLPNNAVLLRHAVRVAPPDLVVAADRTVASLEAGPGPMDAVRIRRILDEVWTAADEDSAFAALCSVLVGRWTSTRRAELRQALSGVAMTVESENLDGARATSAVRLALALLAALDATSA